jgi:hypothetical protein
MSTSRDADFSNAISNEELSANLMKCAMLVKKGEKDPLIRQTIHDLTFYFTGKRVSGTTNHHSTATAPVAAPPQTSPRALSRQTASHNPLTGVFTKMVGLGVGGGSGGANHNDDNMSVRSEASKTATSAKNAERAKAELRGLGFAQTANQEWCETHFTMGCHCKLKKTSPSQASGGGTGATAGTSHASAPSQPHPKPHFQRPSNPSSALIANGWIEQQRRSKMRVVWKEVLASLVEGRKPGEETTLWIQREVRNATTGKPELEALHQIPVKWLQTVSFFTDRRFILKVYNLQEEFVFRCERSEEAAQNWVLTLRSIQEIERVKAGKKPVTTGLDDWDKLPTKQSSFEDEKKASEHASQSHRVAHATPQAAQAIAQHAAAMATAQQLHPPAAAAATSVPSTTRQHPPDPPSAPTSSQSPPPPTVHRMTIKELRAIAHGAGVMTHGMERSDLERIVQQIAALSTAPANPTPPPPPQGNKTTPPPPARPSVAATAAPPPPSEAELRRKQEEHQRAMEESARQTKVAEEAARARAMTEAQKKAEEEKRKTIEEQERLLHEAAEKKKKADEERQRMEAERLRREEEEHQRRLAEMQAAEQRRRVEEQQRQQQAQWQQQQQNWQKQQAENEQRLAEERRRQEEAYRAQHQQWQQQQKQPNSTGAGAPPPQWQQPQQHAVPPQHPHAPPYTHTHPAQYPSGQAPRHPTPPPPHPPPPPPPPGSSPVHMKYAKMAAQTNDVGQMSLHAIKHGILMEWALQPPNWQTLRPIEMLITSIHAVFPPKFNLPGHDHFKKWTVVTMPEVLSGTQPDDEKLTKVVRKLRFVLHPDKLPRDFSEDQMYLCKLLWDIISDAFEDHKKREEELGWMR